MKTCQPRSGSADWRKSSFSAEDGHCVEVSGLPSAPVTIRDDKVAAVRSSYSPRQSGIASWWV